VPEIIEDGVTGFIVDNVDSAVAAVGRVGEIDRGECRRVFETRFDVTRMARDYMDVYRRLQPCVQDVNAPLELGVPTVHPPETALGVV